MRFRPRTWLLVSLLLFTAAYWVWTYAEKISAARRVPPQGQPAVSQPPGPAPVKTAVTRNAPHSKSYRVSNTGLTEKQLLGSRHAIILRNALIDTERALKLDIPAHLRARGAPGSYIVQSAEPVDQRFYDRLQADGAQFVSYIPNNAALVRATPEQAQHIAGDAMFQAVLPYEPYYKLATPLLPAAVEQQPPQTSALNVTTFPGQRDAALAALRSLGATYMGEDTSPFGPTLTVMVPPDKLAEVAQLPLAQEIEPYAPRRLLNDLTRVTLGVSADTLVGTSNYLNLSGLNVTVNLNDTGVDSSHPDFKGQSGAVRLEGDPNALLDYNGHGTHVAGIIMGNGSMSSKVTNAVPGSIIPGADFRGKATNATLFVQSLGLIIGTTVAAAFQEGGSLVSDAALETNASFRLGPTNLISNNSWGYDGVTSYDMHAASFDAATRDAQPAKPGEHPLLFVFAAGDGGNGNVNGGGGAESSIVSPGTAKNVITVGATDAPRFITNTVTFDDVNTNAIFLPWTDNNNLVAWFSSCGNVGPGTEGLSGRFKPDMVAPGVFIVSCRASNYVDPSYSTQITPYHFSGQDILPGKTNNYTLPVVSSNFPADTEEVVMQAAPNSQSPIPFPTLLLLGAPSGQTLQPLPLPMAGTNVAVLTNNLAGQSWKFGVATTNGQIQPVAYDLTFYLVETNDLGVSVTNTNGYYFVVSNLNTVLKSNYVYQYGTSSSAAAVSGLLALMQEFLQTRMNLTNPSPALLKAMLINGARTLNQQYDFNTQLQTTQAPGPNEQGWGLPNLPNSLPPSLTNGTPSMLLVDQSPRDALATGQWQSYTVNCSDGNATNFPLRITLVWTDPPGDPAAGLALVNNLDVLATATAGTNAQLWIGNDFLSGDIFTEVNSGDPPDFVNNVQNIYIDSTNAPFQFPLTVTVLGTRVNVNAATTQTNQIAQDYALVISSDDPGLSAPLTLASNAISSGPLTALAPYAGKTNALKLPLLTGTLTNFLQATPALVTVASNGAPLLDQRAGANEANLYANGALYTTKNTNGNVAQWHFFVFTNDQFNATNQATNVAFATFLPPNLSTQIAPRTNGADLDLYVSTKAVLTNLAPFAFATMRPQDMSVGRGGNEAVTYSNSYAGAVYYIGVKSEDQQAADFGFYAVAQQAPFSSANIDGSVTYNSTGMPVTIPDDAFGQKPALAFAFLQGGSILGLPIRKVTVTLIIDHGNPGDLIGTFQPMQPEQVVLNNFTGPPAGQVFSNLYNDLADGFGGVNSDGPGSLQNFMGQSIPAFWLLQESDNALLQGGEITSFSVTVSPQQLPTGPVIITLGAGQVFFDYVDVPTDAIFLTNAVTLRSGTPGAKLGIYMNTTNGAPTTSSDGTNLVFTGGGGLQVVGGYLLVGTNSSPIPLSGGRWYYGIYNQGLTTVTFTNQIFFDYNFVPNLVQTYTNSTWTPLTTDGTTNSSQICITSGQQVLDYSVGVRLNDPNLDNLVLQLTSPQGSSIVLFENRGGVQVTNLGLTLTNASSTNYIYTTFTENTNLADVPIKFAPPPYATNAAAPLTVLASNTFEDVASGTYTNGQTVDGWQVATNQVSVEAEPAIAYDGSNYLALASGRLSRTFTTVPGASYELRYYARSPGLTDWWPADDTAVDIVGTNNGTIPDSDVTFDVGAVDRAFTFSGVSPNNSLIGNAVDFGTNVGNFGTNDFTVDFWIKQPPSVTGEQACLEKRPQCQQTINFWEIQIGGGSLGWANVPPGHLKSYIPGNGGLYVAELVSSNAINDGIFHHVALIRNGTTYSYYIDGLLDSSAKTAGIADINNSAMFRAGQSVCVSPGVAGSDSTRPFKGDLDELDLWQRALSPAEVHAIFAAGSSGKYSTNSLYPNFQTAIDGIATNTIIITNFDGGWQVHTNSFIATSNQTTIELAGNPLGVLLDDVVLVQLPYTNFNNFYLPEEPLAPIIGQDPRGCWTLSIWDTRQDSTQPTNGALLSWTLQLTTSSTNVNLIVLSNGVPYNATGVPAHGITYFGVDVPATANYATNILFNASGPMNLLFNQNSLPTGGLPGDVTLLSLPTGGSGSDTLATQGAPPPLAPGRRYFLGVQNTKAGKESFSLQVNFDVSANTNIIALTNGVAMTASIGSNGPQFYSFTVPTNAILATFQLLNLTNGQADLFAREGLPVPGPLSFDYQSLNAGTNDQFIVVTTNSVPVALPLAGANGILPQSPTTWYLSVYNFTGVRPVGYTILATYVTSSGMVVRNLNHYPKFTFFQVKPPAPPGFPANLMFMFTVTNTNAAGVQFTVTNVSPDGMLPPNGNVQLLVGRGVFPTPQDFYIGSFNPGAANQFVSIGTNAALTSLSNTIWYAAVPNTSSINVGYSITASVLTNGLVTSIPLFVGASISSPTNGFTMYWSAVIGATYQIQVSTDLATWTVVTNITASNNTAAYTDAVPVISQPSRFFRLVSP